jgi:iron complex outermembrane receptor protein
VLERELLETMGARRMTDVELRLPNFGSNLSPLTGFGARYVRGLNAAARNIGFDSGYAVFVDGVYAGRYASADRVLQDVARVEYLPGPQGTLFGKNTTLGVVNVVTRAPAATSRAELQLDLGSDGHRAVRGAASVPLGADWAVSATAARQQRDGLVENAYLGTTGNDVDRRDARLALHGEVAGWRTVVSADYYESAPDLIARQRLEGLGALPPRVAENDLPGRLRDRDFGLAVTAQRTLPAGNVTAIGAYRGFETTATADDDAWALPAQHLLDWQERTRQLSQELRLESRWGPIRYLAGGYLLVQEARSSRTAASFIGQARADGRVDSRSYATFVNASVDATERLTAEAGLRWTRESKDLAHYVQDGGGILVDFDRADDRSVTSLTPAASLLWAFTEDVTGYLRFARGFKSGGFNVDLVTAPAITPLEFDDERVDTWELGLRSGWLARRLQLDVAVFRSTYRDLQVSQYDVLPGAALPTLRISNAASAHTAGAELNAGLTLARWLFTARVGYTHGEVDDFPDPLGPGTGNYAGNPLGGPEWTSSVMVQYARPLGGGVDATFTLEHLYQDALGADLTGDPLARSDALSVTNVRAGLAFGRDRSWRVSAWVNNLLDVERVVERHRNPAPGLLALAGVPADVAESTVGLYNEPRTWGLALSRRF